MESRELRLERSLQRLLDRPELNADDLDEGTRAAIREASVALASGSDAPELEELANTVLYFGEQVECIRIVLDRLCEEFSGLRTAVTGRRNQKPLFR